MHDGPDLARRTLRVSFAELATGKAAALLRACEPDATWWLPVDNGDRLSAVDAAARLAELVTTAHAAGVAAIVVAADGGQAVVELAAQPRCGADTTSATTVLDLRSGRITAGRTYFDPAAW